MARIPRADNFQVVPGIRQGRAQAVLSPEQASLPGRRMMAQGEQMGRLGGALADYAQQQQTRINETRVQDAYLTLEREALVLEQEMTSLRGEQAVGALDTYSERLSESISRLEQGMPEVVRQSFRARADNLQNRFFGQALKHEADQFEAYRTSILDATVVQSFEMISADPMNAERVGMARDSARAALTEKYREAGLTGAALDQEVRSAMGKATTVVIDNMLNAGNGAGAKQYFEAVRDQDMLITDAEALENRVNKGAAVSEAMVSVDALLAEMPMDMYKPADADKWLRDNISDPETLKAARSELNYRRAQYEEQEKLQTADAYDEALRVAGARGIGAASGTAAWNSLSPAQQNAIRDYIEGRAETMAARAETRAARERSAAQRGFDITYYDIVYAAGGPERLAAMSEGDFRDLRWQVGEDNFGKLLQLRTELQRDPTKAIAVELDNNKFDAVALRYGYDPTSNNRKRKLELSLLRSQIEDQIAVRQQDIGRALTRAEKDAVIAEAFATGSVPAYVPADRELFGGAKPIRIDRATAEQLSRVRVRDIPEDERMQIVEALGMKYNRDPQERFDPTKEENIVAMYLALRGAGAAEETE